MAEEKLVTFWLTIVHDLVLNQYHTVVSNVIAVQVMAEKSPQDIQAFLCDLHSDHSGEVWATFVEAYGPLLLQVVHLFEKDADSVRNCFVFICEQLAANHFKRLRQYHYREGASFGTWLRAVARNLCIDWRRKSAGRRRTDKAVGRLVAVEQEIYRLYFLDRLSPTEVLHALENSYPGLTELQVSAAIERIYNLLTPRQRWLLSIRTPRLESLSSQDGEACALLKELLSPAANPEELLTEKEQRFWLSQSLCQLSESEQILLHLRFVEGQSLRVCADRLGLGNPQRADRLISGVLSRLRALLSI